MELSVQYLTPIAQNYCRIYFALQAIISNFYVLTAQYDIFVILIMIFQVTLELSLALYTTDQNLKPVFHVTITSR